MNISSRRITIIFFGGLLMAVVISLAISSHLSQLISTEVRNRELALLFGAIESGPLAIARLQAAEIAQQQLTRLMANPQLENRGLVSAKIKGGPDLSYDFAHWKGSQQQQPCLKTFTKSYRYDDSLNPFLVEVVRDECYMIGERRIFLGYSGLASLLITFLTLACLVASIWPVADSIRRAERALSGPFSDIDSIPFIPIRSLVRQANRSIELERDMALTTIATQVSHDIRSPLTALQMVTAKLDNVSDEKKRLIHNATQRINEIANQLLNTRKNNLLFEPKNSRTIIPPIIKSMVAEKRAQYADKTQVVIDEDIDPRAREASTTIDSGLLARILSNLVNNSMEAIATSGRIVVALRSEKNGTELSVSDNGCGISSEVLAKIGQQGFSHGKASGREGGSGLGLVHARNSIEQCGGSLSIQSKEGVGTIVILRLPSAAPTPDVTITPTQ
jgi:signal transduction histidine kinase